MEECVFCKIIKGEIPSFKVFENDKVMAFADISPISPGHTLVIPKKHSENIWDISEDDLTAVHGAAKIIATALKKTLGVDGVAALQLNGRAVHQEVMHFHLHLVPRRENDPPLPITQWRPEPGNMEEVKSIADKIAAALA